MLTLTPNFTISILNMSENASPKQLYAMCMQTQKVVQASVREHYEQLWAAASGYRQRVVPAHLEEV